MSVALKAVNSSMKSIASNAKSAQKSLTSMKSSVNIVNDGLDALGNKAKSAIKSLISEFSNAESKGKIFPDRRLDIISTMLCLWE